MSGVTVTDMLPQAAGPGHPAPMGPSCQSRRADRGETIEFGELLGLSRKVFRIDRWSLYM